ncbi:MFS transporter [Nocardioides insulae]|uniref:MFS transporter n=1 Tax=Nocardioides insulae TaxID=394734 RepID=UPI00040D0C08|nr:MFS transporter [Nocardioides insulae]
MPMLESYRRLLQHPGTLRFSLLGLVARLPISMVGLGIVLLVEAASSSYAVAGLVSASFMVANAVAGIGQGRLLDRFGQGRVLSICAMVFGVGMVLLIVSVLFGWSLPVVCLSAAIGGAALPLVGSAARARWAYVLGRSRQLQTAFALEGVVDEAVFITGPMLVTFTVATIHPVAGLGSAAIACVVGTLAFSAQRDTEPPPHPRPVHPEGARASRPPMPWRTVAPLAVVAVALGVLFGASEVVTIAFADEQDQPTMAGVLLAVMAVGSLIAGLAAGAVQWRRGPVIRVRWGALAMGLAWLPALFASSVAVLALIMFLGGLAIAPTLAATFSVVEQAVPPARITEGMGIMHTGITAGVAPGASLSGLVVDHHTAASAYAVCLVAGLVAAAAAVLLPGRPAEPSVPPETG